MITATGWTWEYVDELILPQVYALFDYWMKNPPLVEAMRIAWLKVPERSEAAKDTGGGKPRDSGDVGSFIYGFPGVNSDWVGPPPMKVADVIQLAERAKAKRDDGS